MSAPDFDIETSPTGGKRRRYWETYVVCGKECKAYSDLKDPARCAGCYQPFHVKRCGSPHACDKCLDTLPKEERNSFVKKQSKMGFDANVLLYICLLPVAIFGAIGVFGRSPESIFFLLIALGLALLTIAFIAPLGNKMREKAFAIFDAHPVPGVERKKEKTIECPTCHQLVRESSGFVCMRCNNKVCPKCGAVNRGILGIECGRCGGRI
nr:hypothetical protein [Candidatus Sigynarchaeota archaeon]